MDIQKLERSLEVTQTQINRLDDMIAETVTNMTEFDPEAYEAILIGYTDSRNELIAQAEKYRMDIELHYMKNGPDDYKTQ